MAKKILLALGAVLVVAAGVAAMAAFEAHVINVSAYIENALKVSTKEINFGTVFPQEEMTTIATIALSNSFFAQTRVDKNVEYKVTEKPKSFFDAFEAGKIEDRWAKIDQDGNPTFTWNQTSATAGWYKINADYRDDLDDIDDDSSTLPQPDYTAPRLMVPATDDDFTLETRVKVTNPVNYQGAGLLVYKSDGDLVRLELVNYGDEGKTSVYMESQENFVKTGKGWAHNIDLNDVYLKLVKVDDNFTGYYSTDGTSWTPVPVTYGDMTNETIGERSMVGLAVVDNDKSGSKSAFSAEFDFFRSTIMGNLCPNLLKRLNNTGEWQHSLTGWLNKTDHLDTLNIKLDVPCISGYCDEGYTGMTIPKEGEYGCDIWIEVTGFSQ